MLLRREGASSSKHLEIRLQYDHEEELWVTHGVGDCTLSSHHILTTITNFALVFYMHSAFPYRTPLPVGFEDDRVLLSLLGALSIQ